MTTSQHLALFCVKIYGIRTSWMHPVHCGRLASQVLVKPLGGLIDEQQPGPHRTDTLTPTGSSWINQVERWFGFLTNQKVRRGVHKSVRSLEADLRSWIADWSSDPRPSI
ncbi:hypothetical protein EV382_2881 [Micromonospora violae]|uniref:Winged helix-turn helix protein n=1 Tax=Micromonospora violae TaxID=1278207 RepID=A0A4Q7UJ92_9ACTN|nr:hypothetical protein [Micromonospora violae]RZT79659.1 hypothetical protein EV382_2881 [Micromonospora violae]